MYPSDDQPVRVRLLINELREFRQRLVERIEESRALQARAARLREQSRSRLPADAETPGSPRGSER
jgi:regulator of replication initiation timing